MTTETKKTEVSDEIDQETLRALKTLRTKLSANSDRKWIKGELIELLVKNFQLQIDEKNTLINKLLEVSDEISII